MLLHYAKHSPIVNINKIITPGELITKSHHAVRERRKATNEFTNAIELKTVNAAMYKTVIANVRTSGEKAAASVGSGTAADVEKGTNRKPAIQPNVAKANAVE